MEYITIFGFNYTILDTYEYMHLIEFNGIIVWVCDRVHNVVLNEKIEFIYEMSVINLNISRVSQSTHTYTFDNVNSYPMLRYITERGSVINIEQTTSTHIRKRKCLNILQ